MKNVNKIKGEPKVHYSLKEYKKNGSYDIMTDISENFTLVQLMDYLGNANHAIIVVGTGYLTQTTKEHLYLIENNSI